MRITCHMVSWNIFIQRNPIVCIGLKHLWHTYVIKKLWFCFCVLYSWRNYEDIFHINPSYMIYDVTFIDIFIDLHQSTKTIENWPNLTIFLQLLPNRSKMWAHAMNQFLKHRDTLLTLLCNFHISYKWPDKEPWGDPTIKDIEGNLHSFKFSNNISFYSSTYREAFLCTTSACSKVK